MTSAHDLGTEYEAIVRRRTILLAAHVVFGLVAGLALIYANIKPSFHYWQRRGGGLVLWHLFVSWPYLLSAIVCYSGAVMSNGKLAIQLLVLAISTALAIAIYSRAIDIHLSGLALVVVPIAQFALFSCLVMPFAERRE